MIPWTQTALTRRSDLVYCQFIQKALAKRRGQNRIGDLIFHNCHAQSGSSIRHYLFTKMFHKYLAPVWPDGDIICLIFGSLQQWKCSQYNLNLQTFFNLFFKWSIPGHFFFILIFSIQLIVNICSLKFCQWPDLNCRPLVSEATVLPTEPQPLAVNQVRFLLRFCSYLCERDFHFVLTFTLSSSQRFQRSCIQQNWDQYYKPIFAVIELP